MLAASSAPRRSRRSIEEPRESLITLTEAKRRLCQRLGMCEESLRLAGYVRALRDKSGHTSVQLQLDGTRKYRYRRLRPSVVDALADEIIARLPSE